ncbi:MAG: hypothetical protein AB7I19_00120 [Planctomycetota bacterium]
MEFFRKHQRVILFTAGIFALVSFSISGPILSFFAGINAPARPNPTITVDGRTIEISAEDYAVASLLVGREDRRTDFVTAMPPVGDPEGNDSRVEIYAALRRLAIEAGIEFSYDDVDAAIANAMTIGSAIGVTDKAGLWRRMYSSESEFRSTIGEALRIATFVRVQALAVDDSFATIAKKLASEVELITLQVATLDEKSVQAEIEAADVSDDELRTWIDGLSRDDKNARGYLDQNRYRVELAWLDVAAFDPAAFATELADKTFSDDEVAQFYEINKFRLYQKPAATTEPKNPDEPPPPIEYQELDDALKASIRARLAAEAALRSIWDQVNAKFEEGIKPATDAYTAAMAKVEEARAGVAQAIEKSEKPDATDADREATKAAEAAVATAKEAVTAAQAEQERLRAAFDLNAAFQAVVNGRAGFGVTDSGDEPRSTVELESLAPVAPWSGSAAVAALTAERPLSTQVQRTPTHSFHMRLRTLQDAPLKKFEDIRDKARSDWFALKAGEAVTAKVTAFEEELKALAKARIPEKIAGFEKERDEKLETKVNEWKADLETKLAAAREQRDFHEKRDAKSQAYASYQAEVARIEAELARIEDQRKTFLAELQKTADESILDASREEYPQVLSEAANKHGFNVTTQGPLPRQLFGPGRSRDAYSADVRMLWGNSVVTELKAGDATDVLNDPTQRKRYVAVCTEVAKGGIEHLTRRQLLESAESESRKRAALGVMQSFSLEALRKRYDWKEAGTTEIGNKGK